MWKAVGVVLPREKPAMKNLAMASIKLISAVTVGRCSRTCTPQHGAILVMGIPVMTTTILVRLGMEHGLHMRCPLMGSNVMTLSLPVRS